MKIAIFWQSVSRMMITIHEQIFLIEVKVSILFRVVDQLC